MKTLQSNFPTAERMTSKMSRRKLAPSVSKLKTFVASVSRHMERDSRIAEIRARLEANKRRREIIGSLPHGVKLRKIEGGVTYIDRGEKGRFERKIVSLG